MYKNYHKTRRNELFLEYSPDHELNPGQLTQSKLIESTVIESRFQPFLDGPVWFWAMKLIKTRG